MTKLEQAIAIIEAQGLKVVPSDRCTHCQTYVADAMRRFNHALNTAADEMSGQLADFVADEHRKEDATQ